MAGAAEDLGAVAASTAAAAQDLVAAVASAGVAGQDLAEAASVAVGQGLDSAEAAGRFMEACGEAAAGGGQVWGGVSVTPTGMTIIITVMAVPTIGGVTAPIETALARVVPQPAMFGQGTSLRTKLQRDAGNTRLDWGFSSVR